MASEGQVETQLAAAGRPRASSEVWWRAIALWHLWSLDAPTVAVVWTWTVAAAKHVRLPGTALLAMGIAVWMLYAADRLLDVRPLSLRASDQGEFEARHRFHYEHRRWFRLGIGIASLALAALLPLLPAEALRLYMMLGGLLVGYFVVIHSAPVVAGSARAGHRMPKEIAVGVFFAAAVFIPTVARVPELRLRLLPEALLLGALCSLNCLYIYRWEHRDEHPRPAPPMRLQAHGATRLALCALPQLTIGVIVAGLGLAAWRPAEWLVPLACSVAGALLLLLDRLARTMSEITLRAAADLCLLTPALFLPWLLPRLLDR